MAEPRRPKGALKITHEGKKREEKTGVWPRHEKRVKPKKQGWHVLLKKGGDGGGTGERGGVRNSPQNRRKT